MIELLVGLLVLTGLPVGLGFVFWLRSQNAKWAHVFERVAKAHDLEVAELSPLTKAPADALLGGVVEGRAVVVSSGHEGHTHVIEVSIAEVSTGRLKVQLEREGVLAKLEKLFGARELETGDSAFDRRFYVHASHFEAAQALLGSAKIRQALISSDVDRVEVESGTLTLRYEVHWWRPSRSSERLPDLIEGSIEAGLKLAQGLQGLKVTGQGAETKTRRPWAAKAMAPVASLLCLGALLGVAQVLDSGRQSRQQTRVVEFVELKFSYQALAVARNRGLNARLAEDRARFAKYGVQSSRDQFDESRLEAQQDHFAELRRIYASLVRDCDDPSALQARLTKRALAQRDQETPVIVPISDEVMQGVLQDVFRGAETPSGS